MGELIRVDAYQLPREQSRIRSRVSNTLWSRLPAYDETIPTGVRVGKRWRRLDRDGAWIGSYQFSLAGGVRVVFRPVAIQGMGW